ncbi:MAG: leukotriene A4 hydrolase C-terminal domain-containing protein, partial [Flavobacteriales bacterium]
GNLVTNSTWNDFWLNEGFTVYFEERIMEAVYGREYSEMLAQLSRRELDNTVADLSMENPKDTWLKLELDGRNPDDGMTDIAYNKGYFFLRLCEETVGREKWDAFIKKYFNEHAFQVMDTETFLDYLKKHFEQDQLAQKVNIEAWVYGPGLPANIPIVQSDRMEKVKALGEEWSSKKVKTAAIPWAKWSYQEKTYFLNEVKITDISQLAELDKAFDISNTKNNEVLFSWLMRAVEWKYAKAYPQLEAFLTHVGRRKFVAPLFENLVKTNQQDLAMKIYEKSRKGYHAVTIDTVDRLLNLK